MKSKSIQKLSRPSEDGVALLMAMVFVLIMTFLAVEVSYDAQVEYRVTNSELDRLRAYYAAKSGLELSLYRINLYKQISGQMGAALGSKASLLDMIWQFPFSWPPVVPDEINSIDRDKIKESVKAAVFDAQYVSIIEPEGSKIDINDLASPSEALAKSVRDQLIQLVKNRLDADDEFARANRGMRPEELVNNIADYIDKDSESRNGGTESSQYKNLKGLPASGWPPNEPMKTIDELHQVAGMTDEWFQVFAPRVTVYGIKGVNVNKAPKDILRTIDPQITEQIADEIIKRRTDPNLGPFKDGNDGEDFKSYLKTLGLRMEKFNESKLPLYFGSELNFRVKSVGQFGRATREIIAITYDFDTVKGRLKALLPTPSPQSGTQTGAPPPSQTGPQPGGQQPGAQTGANGTNAGNQPAAPKSGRPPIVYWLEN